MTTFQNDEHNNYFQTEFSIDQMVTIANLAKDLTTYGKNLMYTVYQTCTVWVNGSLYELFEMLREIAYKDTPNSIKKDKHWHMPEHEQDKFQIALNQRDNELPLLNPSVFIVTIEELDEYFRNLIHNREQYLYK